MMVGRFVLLALVVMPTSAWAVETATPSVAAPSTDVAAVTPPPATPPPATPPPATPPPATPPPATPPPATQASLLAPDVAPFGIENANGSLKLGLLLQPQYQLLGDTTFSGQAQDLYVRRARILIGGSLFGLVDYFFDTDYPDLFLSRAAVGSPSVKYTPALSIQDAFVTYKPFHKLVMLDAGYFLPPMAHNALQSAATLFGWDYFKYTFQHDQAFGSPQNLNPPSTPAGRDTGVQLRGLLLDGHLEYRVGAFQGLRNAKTTSATGAQNDFRITSRLQINFLDAEPGFFYAGTYLGRKRIVSIGASYDFQNSLSKDYLYLAGDVFVDLPLGPGVLTAQVNVAHWNGHSFIPAVAVPGQTGILLEDQTALMAEAGYTFYAARLSPIVRFEHLEGPLLPPQDRYGGGLALWLFGHNLNLKAFYTRITQQPPPGAPPYHSHNQFNLQGQVYYF
jgi:Phosphate-selective porin O and P